MFKYLFLFSLLITNSPAYSEDISQPFDFEICKYPKGSFYKECKDWEMEKGIGKYWKEMKEFWFKFQDAVKNDQKEILADMMNYPLSVFYLLKPVSIDEPNREMLLKEKVINDKEEFIANYDFIFNPKFKKQIIEEKYTDLLVFKNVLMFHSTYSTVSIRKHCDFTKIKREDCPYMKVYYLTNDAVLDEEFGK
ncbi:MAG: hypothetical protein J0H68_09205 [Sphingobacteriia bacterium]|nr:hypothetical protein [Sphingobacteriia bacterium]